MNSKIVLNMTSQGWTKRRKGFGFDCALRSILKTYDEQKIKYQWHTEGHNLVITATDKKRGQ